MPAIAVAAAVLAITGVAAALEVGAPDQVGASGTTVATRVATTATTAVGVPDPLDGDLVPLLPAQTTTTTARPAAALPPAVPPPPVVPKHHGALCIGDSVMKGSGPGWRNLLTMCGLVDAVESRQMRDADDVLRRYAANLPDVVVIHLGTNSPFTDQAFDEMMSVVKNVPRVVVVNVQLPDSYGNEPKTNGSLARGVARWKNAVLADWQKASVGHPEYFGNDAVHPNDVGAQVYANVIASTV